MIHGGREEQQPSISSNIYARAVSRIAAAQTLADGLGIRSAQSSFLDSLSDIAIKYMLDIGRSAKQYSNISGRSESNAFDVVRALEDISPRRGLSGAAEIGCCLIASPMVQDIRDFVQIKEGIQFGHPLPRFPIGKRQAAWRSFACAPETTPMDHVPKWLPVFPEPRTYLRSSAGNGVEVVDKKVDRLNIAKQRRRAAKSFLNLQIRLDDCKARALEESKARALPESNGFLFAPLQFGARATSVKPVGFLEPVIEAAKVVNNGMCHIENDREDVLPKKATPFSFKLRVNKQTLTPVVPLVRAFPDRWVARGEERNDKKRRMEFIIRESMENPHDLFRL